MRVVMLLALASAIVAAQPVDNPIGDHANVLAPDAELALAEKLRGLRSDGVDMLVVLVQTMDGVPIERYARSVAERWSQGRTAAAVLVLAIADRKSRLEVSDTLRPKFPDSRAQAILDNARGYLRNADYAGAVGAIIDEVGAAARGEAPSLESPHPQSGTPATTPTTPPSYEYSYEEPERRDYTWVWALVIIAVLLAAGAVYASATRQSTGTFTHDGVKHMRPFVADWLWHTLKIVGFIAMVLLIVAASGKSSSSSSSSWSSSSRSSFSGGGRSSGGGGWSGGGASSSW